MQFWKIRHVNNGEMNKQGFSSPNQGVVSFDTSCGPFF